MVKDGRLKTFVSNVLTSSSPYYEMVKLYNCCTTAGTVQRSAKIVQRKGGKRKYSG